MSLIPIETWRRMGFDKDDLIDSRIRLSAANKGLLRVMGRTQIIALNLGERNLWKCFLVAENLDESDQPTLEELEMDKPVLPEIAHLGGKVTDEQLEAIEDVLYRNQDVFLRQRADIGCCNFVEHEIELEESRALHREMLGI